MASRSFAILLNNALANPNDDQAREALDLYSFFQSIRKIHRRSIRRNSPCLNELFDLQPRFNLACVPSREDRVRIRAILSTNQDGAKSHSVLHSFLRDHPGASRAWLPEFHRFFTWFLRIVIQDVTQLREQRASILAPVGLPESQINRAYNNLAVLKFFSWESDFFAVYISEVFKPVILDPANVADIADVGLLSGLEETVLLGSLGEKEPEKESLKDEGENDMGLDISTEYETGAEQGPMTTALWGEPPHPCILELRLISSNVQNLNKIVRRAPPRSRFRFQVIQYAPSGQLLKHWRDLIHELFPQPELRTKILQTLAETPGGQFKYFRPGGPDLKFHGQAHCEAVLGCLFSLAKRGEDTSWVILHSYSLYFPSY